MGKPLNDNNRVTPINRIWQEIYDEANTALRIIGNITIDPGDINIGAVEIKNKDTDDRLCVNADGTINVNIADLQLGTTTDASSDDSGDGVVSLTGSEDTILSLSIGAGQTYKLMSWDYVSSKQCTFLLKIMDGLSLVRIIRARVNHQSRPDGQIVFPTPITIAGGASIALVVTAQTTNGNSGGEASTGLNGFIV